MIGKKFPSGMEEGGRTIMKLVPVGLRLHDAFSREAFGVAVKYHEGTRQVEFECYQPINCKYFGYVEFC